MVALMGFATDPWQLAALRVGEGSMTGTVAASAALVATSAPGAASATPWAWCRLPSSLAPREGR